MSMTPDAPRGLLQSSLSPKNHKFATNSPVSRRAWGLVAACGLTSLSLGCGSPPPTFLPTIYGATHTCKVAASSRTATQTMKSVLATCGEPAWTYRNYLLYGQRVDCAMYPNYGFNLRDYATANANWVPMYGAVMVCASGGQVVGSVLLREMPPKPDANLNSKAASKPGNTPKAGSSPSSATTSSPEPRR